MTIDADALGVGLRKLVEQQDVGEDDAFQLRQTLYRQAPLGHQQVAQIFEAHRNLPQKAAHWIEFFVESLSDAFLTRQDDRILLSDTAEEQLLKALGETTPIMDPGCRRLVLRLMFRATKVSKRFEDLVLQMVYHHLTNDDRRLLVDLPRQPGHIDIVDLQLIRKLVYGAGGQYPMEVSRGGAEFLLRLDRDSFRFVDAEAWRQLLMKAISLHLVGVTPIDERSHIQIDEAAARWFVEQIDGGRTGRNTASLISLLRNQFENLPSCIETVVNSQHQSA